MMTFSVCASLVILAVIAAVFSQQHSDWVLPTDRDAFFPPFFKSEGFYRAVLINLSFAGISTAATALQFGKYMTFWMVRDPFLAILLNLALGLFAALSLRAESTEIKNRTRCAWVIVQSLIGMVFFAFAVWTTVTLVNEKPPDPPAALAVPSPNVGQ